MTRYHAHTELKCATARGFTLAELVVAMTLSAIVIGFVAMFMAAPVNAYIDQSERARLSDASAVITQALRDDMARALPNSVRIRNSGPRAIVEMLRVDRVSFYRPAGQLGSIATRELDVGTFDTQFSLFGRLIELPASNPYSPPAGRHLVVSNRGTGNTPRDAYRLAGSRTITPTATAISVDRNALLEESVTLTPGFNFAASDTQNRMFLVSGPVSYICNSAAATRTLRRYEGYAITAGIPTTETSGQLTGATSNKLLATNIGACRLRCISGNAIDNICETTLSVEITVNRPITGGNESIRIFEQFAVDNST